MYFLHTSSKRMTAFYKSCSRFCPLRRAYLLHFLCFLYFLLIYSTRIISVVSIAVCTSSSIFSSSFLSERLIAFRFGFVTGCLATKMVQQSSNGKIEVSYVQIRSAMLTISCLSKPITGRNTGRVQTSFVAARLCIVWLATCPMLSPVISA